MPSGRVTANTTAQTIVTAPKIKSGVIASIHINNRYSGAVQVTLQDKYTPTGGTEKTVTKITLVPVPAGESFNITYGKPEIEFIGSLQAVADTTTTLCEIVVDYELR